MGHAIRDTMNHEGHVDIVSRIRKLYRPGMVPMTGWIEVDKALRGGHGEVDFNAPWVNVGDPYQTVAFHLSEDGKVYIRGAPSGGDIGTVIFTLPAGFRPNKTERFICASSTTTPAVIQIDPNGDVRQIA